MSDITNRANHGVVKGIDDKLRTEKWAYDSAICSGAPERYRQGFARMATIRENECVTVKSRVRDVIQGITFRNGNAVPRPAVIVNKDVTFKLSPNARIGAHSVCSPFRAIRAAIQGIPNDARQGSGNYERSQERARRGVEMADGLASAAKALDDLMMARARHVLRGNAKARADFRAECHTVSKCNNVIEALAYVRDGGFPPTGKPNTQVCESSQYYLNRVKLAK